MQANGTEVGEVVFDGRARKVVRFTVAQTLLSDGSKSDHVRGAWRGVGRQPGGRAAPDLRGIQVPRRPADALWFTAQGEATDDDYRLCRRRDSVVDLTDPDRPVAVQTRAAVEGLDGFAVRFTAPRDGVQRLLAFSAGAIASPALVANARSTWYAPHAADYLLSRTATSSRVSRRSWRAGRRGSSRRRSSTSRTCMTNSASG